jgi:L-ascorbate metabolism protein UlaG (beta-lactamase superfamily)
MVTTTAAGGPIAQESAPMLDGENARLNPAAWRDDALTLSNLGHATLLINFYGMRVITDPSLFEGVGLSMSGLFTIGPHRYNPPPLTPEQIPAPDVILITHAHMDHLDIPSLRALPKSAVVIACDRCGDLIAPLGFSEVRELKWGESTTVNGLTVTAMGARHWGRRWPPLGKDRGFNSYVLDKDGHRMLVGCDSALTEAFTPLRANPPEVAAFSIGAYDPWIWNHANPEQVWTMFQQTGAQWLVPIHWGTFKLSREPMDEPLARLNAAAGAQRDRIVLQAIGTTWTMPTRAQSAAAGR